VVDPAGNLKVEHFFYVAGQPAADRLASALLAHGYATDPPRLSASELTWPSRLRWLLSYRHAQGWEPRQWLVMAYSRRATLADDIDRFQELAERYGAAYDGHGTLLRPSSEPGPLAKIIRFRPR
jgi:hypothetical protein